MRASSRLLLALLLLGVVGCDHTSKQLAESHLAPSRAVTLVPDVLELRLVRNTDTAFNLLGPVADEPTRWLVILALQGLATVAMALVLLRRWRFAGVAERVAGVLVLGGALGNLTERMVRGYVVDFIHVHHWPVFNVADIALCVGIPLLAVAAGRARAPASE